jgi:hypothetical protein
MPAHAGRPTWVTHQDGIYLAEHVARSADGAAVSSYRKGILLERGPAGTPATLQLAAAAPQMAEALRAVVASPGWAALPADVRRTSARW